MRLGQYQEQFLDQIVSEMHKIDAFFMQKLTQFELRKVVLQNRIDELQGLPKGSSKASQISLRQALLLLQTALQNIKNFTQLNHTGFVKVCLVCRCCAW